jgi:hypothetical protein
MARVNFSVPDNVKAAFDSAFGERNKSAVIAELMRRAVSEEALHKRREVIVRTLVARGPLRPRPSDKRIRSARVKGRP